jgi:tetratricopeptide (TPR) repeat protein
MNLSEMERGILHAKNEDYLVAMNLLMDAYNSGQFTKKGPQSSEALSYYGLCIALVQKRYKLAIEFCQRAIDMHFYWPDHYLNLAKVYLAASMRRKAVEAADKGLSLFPEDVRIKRLRIELGVRARPAVPFLDRANPLNQSLGRSRHAAKLAARERRNRAKK